MVEPTKAYTLTDTGAGYSPKSAGMIASETLRKPNVQEALQAEMAKQGITLEQAIAPISKALGYHSIY